MALVRVYSMSIVQRCCSGPWIFRCRRYAPPGLPLATTPQRYQARKNASLSDIALHWKIRNKFRKETDSELKDLAFKIRRLESYFRKLKKRWTEASSKKEKLKYLPNEDRVTRYYNLVKDAERIVIKSADIVICTCSEVASQRFWYFRKPSQCLVDEAGQSTEPETFAAIAQTTEKVVLLGDHKQLRPVVFDMRVKEILSRSLFERLSKSAFTLKVQYRMVSVFICIIFYLHYNCIVNHRLVQWFLVAKIVVSYVIFPLLW